MASSLGNGLLAASTKSEDVSFVDSKYTTNVVNHILEHYELNVHSLISPPAGAANLNNAAVTLPALTFNHVYGDYTLDYVPAAAPNPAMTRLQMRQVVDHTTLQVSTADFSDPAALLPLPVAPPAGLYATYPLNPFINECQDDTLNGLYQDVSTYNNITHIDSTTGVIPWLVEDLQGDGLGSRYLLPSIGTQVVKIHETGNRTDELKSIFVEEMMACVNALDKLGIFTPARAGPMNPAGATPLEADTNQFNAEYFVFQQNHRSDGVGCGFDWNFDTIDERISPVMNVFIRMLMKNQDLTQLWTDAGITIIPDVGPNGLDDPRPPNFVSGVIPDNKEMYDLVSDTNRSIYRKNATNGNRAAVRRVAELLFRTGSQQFMVGDEVSISNNALRRDLEDPMNSDQHSSSSATFQQDPGYAYDSSASTVQIYSASPPPGRSGVAIMVNGKIWANEDPANLGDVDVNDPTSWRWIPISQLKASYTYDPDTVELTGEARFGGKDKKKKKQPRPLPIEGLVFQRIVFDTLATLQTLLYFPEEFRFRDQINDNQFEQQLKMRYLSSGLNVSVRNSTVNQQYPNIRAYTRATNLPDVPRILNRKPPKNKKGQKRLGLLDFLANIRAYYTISTLANMRSKLVNTKAMDDFYSNDILEQEVGWMASLLSDTTQYAIRKDEVTSSDYTAQLQYDDPLGSNNLGFGLRSPPAPVAGGPPPPTRPELSMPPGTPPGTYVPINTNLSLGYMPKRTVFYDIDSPLLKEIIADYIQVYNQMTIANTFEIESGTPKDKEFAFAMWGSVRNRTSGLFDIGGVKPHLFFNRLFNSLNDRLGRATLIKSHYPPSWLGDNTIQKLRRDPQMGGAIEVEEGYYQKKLNEYIDHLGSVYSNNFAIPREIISQVEQMKIASSDSETLKSEFMARLKNDNSKKSLKGTWFRFKPYGTIISIMRAHLHVPFTQRQTFVADRLNQQQIDQIRDDTIRKVQDPDRIYDVTPIAPPGHPLRGE